MSIGVIAAHDVIASGGGYAAAVAADTPAGWWRVGDSGTPIVSISASSSFSTLPPENAFDLDMSSEWATSGASSGWLQVRLASGLAVTQYAIRREDGNPNDNPRDWTFQGSNDGSTWTTLDTRTGITWPTAGETKTFTFTNSTTYTYYRLNVTANASGSFLRVIELMIGTAGQILKFTDSSGNGHDAAAFAVTPGAAGAITDGSAAATFDGSTSHADVPYGSWMDLTTAFTIEAWVKTTATGVRSIADRDKGSSRVYQFRTNGGSLEFIKISGSVVSASQACSINDGNWHHVVATYDGSNIRLYKDGTLINTTAAAGNLSGTDPLTIGANRSAGYGQFFNGQIDEVAYYKSVLSGTRIAAHYAAR